MAPRQVVGVFGGEEDLLAACRAARERGLTVVDAFLPYPVRGLDEALGLRRTRLPRVCFACGLLGLLLAFGFQLWASAFDWPINIGGKPYSAVPALVPITFELTILFAAIGTVAAFLLRARLRPGAQPSLAEAGVTDDRFALVLDPSGGEVGPVRELLESHGAEEVREVEGAR